MSATENKRNYINLVGFECQNLSGSKLPVRREVLSLFLYKHRTEKLVIRESAKFVLCEVIKVWNKFLLPANNSYYSIVKIEKLYNEWLKTQVHKGRKNSSAQKVLEKNFIDSLDVLFDIALQNSVQNLSSHLKKFLSDSREIRKSSQLLTSSRNIQEVQKSTSTVYLENDLNLVEVEISESNLNANGVDVGGI